VEVIHVRDRHILASDNEVVGDENRCHGAQENGVAAEESEELGSRCENFPLDLWSARQR
jgi:hypothetical protein